jgi:hypothetical protein
MLGIEDLQRTVAIEFSGAGGSGRQTLLSVRSVEGNMMKESGEF